MAEEKKKKEEKEEVKVSDTKETECVKEEEEKKEPTELEKAQAEAKELKDKYLRLAAEYDNFRKRTSREREMVFGDAVAATLSSFLTVYDNLERALGNHTEDEAYKKGVELIFAQMCDTLKKMNIETINPENETFDPNFHNAVMHEENGELGENTVSEVFQKGFKLGERVIRPALVKVAN